MEGEIGGEACPISPVAVGFLHSKELKDAASGTVRKTWIVLAWEKPRYKGRGMDIVEDG